MKIYTKKGDAGQTGLFGGGAFPKDDLRVTTYGSVDELNSVVGLATAQMKEAELRDLLIPVQKQLFVLGAELATLKPTEEMLQGYLQEDHIVALEQQIDQWEKQLTPLKQFILPGGSPTAAALHLARTVCRRAERQMVSLHREQALRPQTLKYLNRLSDWFFVFARYVNFREGKQDILWEGIL